MTSRIKNKCVSGCQRYTLSIFSECMWRGSKRHQRVYLYFMCSALHVHAYIELHWSFVYSLVKCECDYAHMAVVVLRVGLVFSI